MLHVNKDNFRQTLTTHVILYYSHHIKNYSTLNKLVFWLPYDSSPFILSPVILSAGHFVPGHFVPWSSRPLVISSPLVTSSTSIPQNNLKMCILSVLQMKTVVAPTVNLYLKKLSLFTNHIYHSLRSHFIIFKLYLQWHMCNTLYRCHTCLHYHMINHYKSFVLLKELFHSATLLGCFDDSCNRTEDTICHYFLPDKEMYKPSHHLQCLYGFKFACMLLSAQSAQHFPPAGRTIKITLAIPALIYKVYKSWTIVKYNHSILANLRESFIGGRASCPRVPVK
jgi:hypothetical protein